MDPRLVSQIITTVAIVVFAIVAILTFPGFPPCPTEDSRTCFWDADTRGNGQGRDFIDVFGVTVLL